MANILPILLSLQPQAGSPQASLLPGSHSQPLSQPILAPLLQSQVSAPSKMTVGCDGSPGIPTLLGWDWAGSSKPVTPPQLCVLGLALSSPTSRQQLQGGAAWDLRIEQGILRNVGTRECLWHTNELSACLGWGLGIHKGQWMEQSHKNKARNGKSTCLCWYSGWGLGHCVDPTPTPLWPGLGV